MNVLNSYSRDSGVDELLRQSVSEVGVVWVGSVHSLFCDIFFTVEVTVGESQWSHSRAGGGSMIVHVRVALMSCDLYTLNAGCIGATVSRHTPMNSDPTQPHLPVCTWNHVK